MCCLEHALLRSNMSMDGAFRLICPLDPAEISHLVRAEKAEPEAAAGKPEAESEAKVPSCTLRRLSHNQNSVRLGLLRESPNHKWVKPPLQFFAWFWVDYLNIGFDCDSFIVD